MRLGLIRTGGALHLGVVVGDEVADLTAVDDRWTDPVAALRHGPAGMAEAVRRAPRIALAEAALAAPVARPGKFLAIGLNAPDHRRDVNARWLLREPGVVRLAAGYLLAHPRPRYPYFFAKAPSSVSGPYDPILRPPGVRRLDWEGELALVVGHAVRRADVTRARSAIAGYLVTDDVSVRDWQTDNPTGPMLAKGYDTHGPLGPWLTTADAVDPADLELRTWLNGELVQHGRIADLVHSPAEIVSILSQFCTLLPGDVVACGTFAGTGWPRGRFLRDGDVVRVAVDGLGHIENPVVDERGGIGP